MVFGLFKPGKRRAMGMQHTIDFLNDIDDNGRAIVALHCASIRRAEVVNLSSIEMPGVAEMAQRIYYRPLEADARILRNTVAKFNQIIGNLQREEQAVAGDPVAQTERALVVTAFQVLRNTWLACLHPELRPQLRTTWALLAGSFPHVEEVVRDMLDDADRERFAGVIADRPDGPEYRRIPDGFAPEAVAA